MGERRHKLIRGPVSSGKSFIGCEQLARFALGIAQAASAREDARWHAGGVGVKTGCASLRLRQQPPNCAFDRSASRSQGWRSRRAHP
jgi:hypothetical protein